MLLCELAEGPPLPPEPEVCLDAPQEGTTRCSKCLEIKPDDAFAGRKDRKLGRNSHCRVCQSAATRRWRLTADKAKLYRDVIAWRLKNPDRVAAIYRKSRAATYGLTVEALDAMEARGRCDICRGTEPGQYGTWHIDHDHTTGNVRGLLCHYCNVGLGNFKENPASLQNAIEYLGLNAPRN